MIYIADKPIEKQSEFFIHFVGERDRTNNIENKQK